jgi:hypothetical protein
MLQILQVHEEDIMLVKGPTGAPERKPFDTRHECSEREWFVVREYKHQQLRIQDECRPRFTLIKQQLSFHWLMETDLAPSSIAP